MAFVPGIAPEADEGTAAFAAALLATYHRAAEYVLLHGSTPWEVDEAMVEFGFYLGPFELEDRLGLDRIAALLPPEPEDPVTITKRMLELGKLGQKTGAGWYRYPGGGGKVEDPIVADLALEEAHFAKIERQEFVADEITTLILTALSTKVEELIAKGADRATLDRLSLSLLGFPSARTGLASFSKAARSGQEEPLKSD